MSKKSIENKHVVGVLGAPSVGKTASLRNLSNSDKIAYLNADRKTVTFENCEFQDMYIENPLSIIEAISRIEANANIEGGVLDTLTHLMDMFEQQFVLPATDSRKMWQEYASFYKKVMHAIKCGTKNYAILAHTKDVYNETEQVVEKRVPIKGAVGQIGAESDFSTIVVAKQIPVKKLEGKENDLLTITEEEKEDGLKYVFQTRVTADSIGEKSRSPIGLWDRNELYIDNDLELVFKRLNERL